MAGFWAVKSSEFESSAVKSEGGVMVGVRVVVGTVVGVVVRGGGGGVVVGLVNG